MMPPSPTHFAAALASFAAAAALAFAPAASADTTCTKFASTSGSDSAAGTLDAPYRTAQRLADSLSAGDTGCLRRGTFSEDVWVSKGGAAAAPVTLTSYPGERAKIVGRFWVRRGADNVTVASLDLNGRNGGHNPSPTVNAHHARFVDNDVTNDHTDICFLLGNQWGSANGTAIESNRIHDCGVLPAANHDHGIYVEEASDTEIVGNLIYDNADRGIQLYPNAQRTHVARNVIDGNGEGVIFSGAGGDSSNDNLVEDNIITNSNQRNNVESYYPPANPVGHGNVVRHNCIAGGARDGGSGGIGTVRGFVVEPNNVIGASPRFVDRAAKDFRLEPGSACAALADGVPKPAPAAPTAAPAPSSGPAVSLTMRHTRSGRLRLRGRVRRGQTISFAGLAPSGAIVQIRWGGAWHTLRALRLKGARFDSQLRFPAYLRGRALKLRVVVPNVGTSTTVTVRAG